LRDWRKRSCHRNQSRALRRSCARRDGAGFAPTEWRYHQSWIVSKGLLFVGDGEDDGLMCSWQGLSKRNEPVSIFHFFYEFAKKKIKIGRRQAELRLPDFALNP